MELNLRILQVDDVTDAYVGWYSNTEVVRFSDNQYRKFTLEGQCEYVKSCLMDTSADLYGIFDGDLHIGNIVINGLESLHKRAEITYVVGAPSHWGKGVGFFSVASMIELAKNKYKLNKLIAGLAEGNVGSQKILERNGFILEGQRIKHLFYNGEYFNQLDYGLILSA
jgi:ribosomal-protein-alanine N-acetyltransferase|tara:strand:- start:343 stop:846 length:504 start_codon:yes stop_codon:yes gene_type:complete